MSTTSNPAQPRLTPKPRRFASIFPPARHLPDYAVAQWREQRHGERHARAGAGR